MKRKRFYFHETRAKRLCRSLGVEPTDKHIAAIDRQLRAVHDEGQQTIVRYFEGDREKLVKLRDALQALFVEEIS